MFEQCIVVKLKELGRNIDLINTNNMQLPLDLLPSNAEQIMSELQKPISIKVEELVKDLKDFEHDFPREHFCPPHNARAGKRTIPESEINEVFVEVLYFIIIRLHLAGWHDWLD